MHIARSTFSFPRGFLWGTSTSSHQVEGDNTNNNWYAWEQAGRTAHKSGAACDWWGGRWKEDFDRAADAGQNAHRLSVEWSRVQPQPDRWDKDALDHYRLMLAALRERGMTAMVTLHHFTDPLWLVDRGGWERADVVSLFEKFVAKTVTALKDHASLWITINEPNIYSLLGYVTGDFPPGKRSVRRCSHVLANMARAHAVAYHSIHSIQPKARVGYAWHYRPMVAANPRSGLDRLVRTIQYNGLNSSFPSAVATGTMRAPAGNVRMAKVKGTQDFIGLNYYSQDTVAFDIRRPRDFFARRFFPKDADMSATDFIANIPEGFYSALRWAAAANLPIIVTENGVEDAADTMRPRYLAQHLHQMWRGIEHAWPILGYFHWSLVDNFEWERGWTQRFGLWELDVRTQERSKRRSAELYATVCKANQLDSETVWKYCPEVFDRIVYE